jgi:hypothetical protein
MATKPAGGTAYGDLSGTPAFQNVGGAYRNDTTVLTPSASYTVEALLGLINAAVNTAGAVDSTGFGKASR